MIKIFLAFLAVVGMVSCKKSKVDPVFKPVVIEYKINSTVPLKDTSANNNISIQYVNGAGQTITDNSFSAGLSTWIKKDTVTTSTRPLALSLTSPDIYLTGPGLVSGSISIDGFVYSYSSTTSLNFGGVYRGFGISLNALLD